MFLIQLPAFLSILLLLIRGRYHDHLYFFWFIIGAAVLASWLWSVVRVGAHVLFGLRVLQLRLSR